MKIFPAIDLRGGRVVRLTGGDYSRMTTYFDDPAKVARSFRDEGASFLHVVDLDGARNGIPVSTEVIKELAATDGLFVQVGGGIRTEDRIREYLSFGVDRVILGSAAVNNFPWLSEMVSKFAERIAVGVDVRDGYVAVSGWEKITGYDALSFCHKLEEIGVETIIYTDISKDGMLLGTNLDIYRTLSEKTGLKIIASGGISFESEIISLRDMGLYGAIVGKAIYEGALSLRQVISLAREV